MKLDLSGLPGPVGEAPGADEPAARLLQSVMTALPGGPHVLRAGPLAQRL